MSNSINGGLGMDEFGASPSIIDDNNFLDFVREIRDPNTPYEGGYEAPAEDPGMGNCDAMWNGNIIPRRDWVELIHLHEKNQSSPDHWRLLGDCKILNQKTLPYCWIFGPTGAIQVAYAQDGHTNVPHLSATAPGAQGKNFVKRGGWSEEAVGYIKRFGLPTVAAWAEADLNRKYLGTEILRRESDMHNVCEFIKLPTERGKVPFEVLASVILDPEDPMPVATAHDWWGHIIFQSKILGLPSGAFGGKGVNSWGEAWENAGCVALSENKATPAEAIAIRTVKSRVSNATFSTAV